MIVTPYKPAHLESLLLQPDQAHMVSLLANPAYRQSLAIEGKSFTAMEGTRVLGCGGLIPLWEGRAEAWSLLSSNLRREFVGIHRAALRYLDSCGFRRIEATVDAQFERAVVWIEMLGFTYEGPLAKYTPDGRDCLRFARIR